MSKLIFLNYNNFVNTRFLKVGYKPMKLSTQSKYDIVVSFTQETNSWSFVPYPVIVITDSRLFPQNFQITVNRNSFHISLTHMHTQLEANNIAQRYKKHENDDR